MFKLILKDIKKIRKILLWTLAVIAMVLFSAYSLLRTSAVQLSLTQKIAKHFSEKLHTKITVGGIDVEFIKTAVLENVYIEDLHHDTLLFAEKIKVDVASFSYVEQKVKIANIFLQNTKAGIIKHTSDTVFNFQFLVDEFAKKDRTRKDSTGWEIDFNSVNVLNLDLVYRNEHDTAKRESMNFSDLHIIHCNAKLSGLNFNEDTTEFRIEHLSMNEKSGFALKKLSADLRISPVSFKLNNLIFETNRSLIETDLGFQYKSYDDFNHFAKKVKVKASFSNSQVQLDDIAFFASELKGINKKVYLSGDVSGKISDIRGNHMDIVFGDDSHYLGDFQLEGLPDFDESTMTFEVDELTTSRKDMRLIPSFPFTEGKFLEIPENIGLLGKVKFKGTISKLYGDYVSYGNFFTSLGNVYTDLSLVQNFKNGLVSYKGEIRSTNFDIGKFLGSGNYLGKITIDAAVKGAGLRKENIMADLSGKIHQIEFNNYNYKNIDIEGNLSKRVFSGHLNVKEENIDMVFDGGVDFSKSPIKLNFVSTINKADLKALNFVKSNQYMTLATSMSVNLTGNNIDDITGSANLRNTIYLQNKEIYQIKKIDLNLEETASQKTISLTSDVADAYVKGKFKLLELAGSATELVSNYLPSLAARKNKKSGTTEKFDYHATLKNTNVLSGIFLPNLSVSSGTEIDGNYNSTNKDFTMTCSSEKITYGGTRLGKIKLNAETKDGKFIVNGFCKKIQFSDSLWSDDITLASSCAADTIQFNLQWRNKGKEKNRGDVNAYLTFSAQPKIQFKILPSAIVIADSTWAVNSNNLTTIDSAVITIRDLTFTNGRQQLKADGIISHDKNEHLNFLISNLNLQTINILSEKFGLKFKGMLNGTATISNVYDNILFSSSMDFSNLVVNNEEIGTGSVISIFDKKKESISLNGSLTKENIPHLSFSGLYYPEKINDNIDMAVELQNFRLNFFETYVKDIFPQLRGTLSAKVNLRGDFNKPILTGMASVKADTVHVDYLNTDYHFKGEVKIEDGSFGVENLNVYDRNSSKALVSGKIYHDYFKNFQFDLDMQPHKFLCLNTTEAQNSLYYGRAFVTGVVNLFGYMNDIRIDANVKTDKINAGKGTEITKLNIPLSGTQEIGENNFITFVKTDSVKRKSDNYKVDIGGITVNFNIETTPDAEVQVIFDEKIGDVIRAKGNGNIILAINTHGNFNMYGDFTIENGDYLFTLQNVFNKKFRIEKGGTIKWTGNPYQAEIDMKAIYEVRTSIKPFFPYDSSEVYKRRYPVDCNLFMTGNFLSPTINFDISLPTLDASTSQEIKNLIPESEMNKQVFSLLILHSFLKPKIYENIQNFETGSSSATAATSSELLSNQLSNWLSKISNDFDVGVHYRPGDDKGYTTNELEVALSTQLFNDKLSIDGSVANNTNVQNASALVGDVNLEYKITDNGKLKVKGFNRSNDNVIDQSKAPYTQGVGLSYKEEFDTIGELFIRYLNRVKKKKWSNQERF